jgi:non-homologous end joining protein Ku
VEVSKDDLENIALESTRTIDIDEFVPRSDIDARFAIRPYYLVPDGKARARCNQEIARRGATSQSISSITLRSPGSTR